MSSYFQVFQSLYQLFGNRSERANYNWYLRHFYVIIIIIIIIIILLLASFHTIFTDGLFYWSLKENKSSQVSRTFLSIQADFNIDVVYLVSIQSLISNLISLLSRPSKIIPSAPTIIIIYITLHILQLFQLFSKIEVFSIFLPFFFKFLLCGPQEQKNPLNDKLSLLLINTISSLLTWIRRSVCIPNFLRILCVSFTRMDSDVCIYHLVV